MPTVTQIKNCRDILLHNATDWHAYQIINASQCAFIFGAMDYRGAGTTHVPILPRCDLCHLLEAVDLKSSTLPQDVAAQLRLLALHLNDIADNVEKVPGQSFDPTPRAYITRDAQGNVIGEDIILIMASNVGEGYESMTNEDATISCEPLEDYPDLQIAYDMVVAKANAEPDESDSPND